MPCKNKAFSPTTTFRIDAREARESADRYGEIVATFHSHPHTGSRPSSADIKASEISRLASFIYSINQKTISCYRPKSLRCRPLIGRLHFWGIQDCLTLVTDYYERVGIDIGLPFSLPVPMSWDDVCSMMAREVAAHGFARLSGSETPQVGDLALIAGEQFPEPHYAVCVEPGIILHQARKGRSCRDRWEGIWAKCTRAVYRPPSDHSHKFQGGVRFD